MPGSAAWPGNGAAAPDGSACVLVTTHGTVVYYDAAMQRLHQGKLGSCPLNLRATMRGTEVLLWYREDGRDRPLGDFRSDHCTLAAADAPMLLTAMPADAGKVTLCGHGRYMCAEYDGRVTMDRFQPQGWEQFRLMPESEFARVRFVLNNRWIMRSTGALATPAEMSTGHDCEVRIGPVTVSLAGFLRVVGAARPLAGMPRELLLEYDDWKMEALSLYRPLAYYAAFGREQIFGCARLAIQSLFEFGDWQGDVLVITDPARSDFVDDLKQRWPGRIHVRTMMAHDTLDFTLARYQVGDTDLARDYQPLIYIDTDVVADAPLDEVLRPVALRPDLHAPPEGPLHHGANFYGAVLLEADNVSVGPERIGHSTGILAFRNVDDQAELFRAVIQSAYRYMAQGRGRDLFGCYDQPFLNYLAVKTGADPARALNGDVLGRVVTLKPVFDPPMDRRYGTGLMHFAGGVGNSIPKLEQMEIYMAALARHAAMEPQAIQAAGEAAAD